MSIFSLAVSESPAISTNLWLDYAKTLFVLAGICLLALVAAKILLPQLTGLSTPAVSQIQVIAKYPLEPRKTLYLVKAGKTVVLLAGSAETVQFMTTLNPGDFEELSVPAHPGMTRGSVFRHIAQAVADRSQEKAL